MFSSFEEKGKIFTNVVKKIPVQSIIQTSTHQIKGQIYVRPDDRIKDELNSGEDFLAVTDARVYDLNGKELYRCKFLTLNRTQVIWLIPENDLIVDYQEGE